MNISLNTRPIIDIVIDIMRVYIGLRGYEFA